MKNIRSLALVLGLTIVPLMAHASNFPTGIYTCNKLLNGNPAMKLIAKVNIEEVTVGSTTLPMVQIDVAASPEFDVPKSITGIGSIATRKDGSQSLTVAGHGSLSAQFDFDVIRASLFSGTLGTCTK